MTDPDSSGSVHERPQLVEPLTDVQALAHERLKGLDALTEHLSHTEADMFRSYMLGFLSGLVSQDDWENALGGAMESSNTWLRTVGRHADRDD